MDFLGIGFTELLLILILSVIFIGPDKLPAIAAKAGQLYRSFKKATLDLSKSITEELPIEDTRNTPNQEPTTKTKAENMEKAQLGPGANEEVHER